MATARFLGYKGSATIGGSVVCVTSAQIDEQRSPVYLTPLGIPSRGSADPFSRYIYAEGTRSSTGSISFDFGLTSTIDYFKRTVFDVAFGDGSQVTASLGGCFMTSASANGSVGGLITGSVSFVSKNEFTAGSITPGGGSGLGSEPAGYWRSGGGSIKEWSLSASQDAKAIWANTTTPWPDYIKVGTTDYTLNITSYDIIPLGDTIDINLNGISIVGLRVGETVSFNGATDFGDYSYTFESTAGPQGSGQQLIQGI